MSAACLAVLLTLIAPAPFGRTDPIIGVWVGRTFHAGYAGGHEGAAARWEFRPDGTFFDGHARGTWRRDREKIRISHGGSGHHLEPASSAEGWNAVWPSGALMYTAKLRRVP